MPRPCECDKASCRLCMLFHHEPRYTALWGQQPTAQREPKAFPPVRHDKVYNPVPERTYLISLARRQDRREQALAELNKAGIAATLFEAIDGETLNLPAGWKDGKPALGCRDSHRAILAECVNDGVSSVMVLEDDLVLVADFQTRLKQLLTRLPTDADALLIGGQYVKRPEPYNESLVRCVNTHRTHAYLILNTAYMDKLYHYWDQYGHIDKVWAEHQKADKVYSPSQWLAGQRKAWSDIKGREMGERWWKVGATPRVKAPIPKGCLGCGKQKPL